MGGENVRIDIRDATEALRTLHEVDLSQVMGTVTHLLRMTADPLNEQFTIQGAEPEVINILREKGFVVNEDFGDIEQFKDVTYNSQQIRFLLDIAIAVNELNKFIQLIGVEALIQASNRYRQFVDLNHPDGLKHLAQNIEANNRFLDLIINLFNNYTFTLNGSPVEKGVVINNMLNELLLGKSSPFRKWYGEKFNGFFIAFRNGTAAAFSGWLAVRNLSSENSIRTPDVEEDLNGVDLVTMNNSGEVVRYYQIKSMSDPEIDQDILIYNSEGSDFTAPPALLVYIETKIEDVAIKKIMRNTLSKLEFHARKNRKPWSWFFVRPNYFVNRS